MKALPTVLFGIKIEKSLFGKMPKSAIEDPARAIFKGLMPPSLNQEKEEMINFYGEGYFEPFDVVQMRIFPGQVDLLTGLHLFDAKYWYERLVLGEIVDTNEGKALVFGYVLPENWGELQLKANPTQKRWEFTIIEDGALVHIGLPPVAISIPASYWTNSSKKLSALTQLTISDMSPNEFSGWLDYADSLVRSKDDNGNRVFAYLMKSVIEHYGVQSCRIAYIYWRIAQVCERNAVIVFGSNHNENKFVSESLAWLKKARQIYSNIDSFDRYEGQLGNPKLEEIDAKIAYCRTEFADITENEINEIFTGFFSLYTVNQ